MVDSNRFQDVHIYDGKLKNLIHIVRFSKEDKDDKFEILINQLSSHTSKLCLQNIINGISTYNEDNELDGSDILMTILNKDYINILPIIEEQLTDILLLGSCSSGICCRLFQILNAIL